MSDILIDTSELVKSSVDDKSMVKKIWIAFRFILVGLTYFVFLWLPFIIAAKFGVDAIFASTRETMYDNVFFMLMAIIGQLIWVATFHWADVRPNVLAVVYGIFFPVEAWRKRRERN